MDIFGFQINKKKQSVHSASAIPQTPITPNLEGSSIVQTFSSSTGGYYSYAFDLDGEVKNEIDLINRYREISNYPDCGKAIDQITNDAIITDQEEFPVTIDVSDLDEKYEGIKEIIEKEFDTIIKLYKFNQLGHDIFRRWYIDGHLFYYANIDPKNPKKGILELSFIDPRKIKKVVNIEKETKNQIEVVKNIETFYLFNDAGIVTAINGIKLSPNVVIDVNSGMANSATGLNISYLYKAIKPTNQLKMLEDAMVIYRISRAPERRLFYIDVGNMQPQRAEQYVQQMMTKFKNKIQYDPNTGEVKENRNFLSMQEDFWLPRREGGRSTEIQTLPGANNLSEISDIEYFQNKLYNALNVPIMRMKAETGFSIGRSTEISREEVTFNKFIQRLRNKFSDIFRQALRIQFLAKNILNENNIDDVINDIKFKYQTDNYFEEIKKMEALTERLNVLATADSYVDKYFSLNYVATKILHFSEDEWKTMQEEIKKDQNQENADNDENESEDNETYNDDNESEDNETNFSDEEQPKEVNSDEESEEEPEQEEPEEKEK